MYRYCVSIIVCMYKGECYIQDLISMTEKNYYNLANRGTKSVELILVNDNPESPIMLSDSFNIPIKVVQNRKNVGIHASKLNGLKVSEGEYIHFLDQDDYIADNFLVSQLSAIGNNDAIVANGTHVQNKVIFSEDNPFFSHDWENYFDYNYFLVSLGQLLIRKSCIPNEWRNLVMKHNGWDDQWMWFLLMVKKIPVAMNNELLYTHVEHVNNFSGNRDAMKRSADEFIEKVIDTHILDEKEEKKFTQILIERRQAKRSYYDSVNLMWEHVDVESLKHLLVDFKDKTVAIYGFAKSGKRLYNLLHEHNIDVKYAIDRRDNFITSDIPLIHPERDSYEMVDLFIVTPTYDFDTIKKSITEKVTTNVISIVDFLEQVIEC